MQLTFAIDHTENVTIGRYGDGIAALDMMGRFRELAHTVPLTPRRIEPASCKAPMRGDRMLDTIGVIDKTLEVAPLPEEDTNIPSSAPLWWEQSHGEYPHRATLRAVKWFFGFPTSDRRAVWDTLPKNSYNSYDLAEVREVLVKKGII